MLEKRTGIVLRTLKYKENNLIVDLYTRESGKLSFITTLSRSRRSSLKPVLFQPLTILEIEAEIKPNRQLHKIKECRTAVLLHDIYFHPYKSAIAMFMAEFLFRAIQNELENTELYDYIVNSILWLDACDSNFSNFHLVFLMRLSRFIGLYPNIQEYREGFYFDLANGSFTPVCPTSHPYFIQPEEAGQFYQLMRMKYKTMHLFSMNRGQRMRCLQLINDYYRLHIPNFPELKSLEVLKELFS